jgi:SAM-dependent methyltransferase
LFASFAEIAGAARVLDVGCGTGNLGLCLTQDFDVASVCGVDLSPAYIEHACRRNAEPKLTFQVGDACALPFKNKEFDHTVSMLALQFVPQADIALQEMCRVTRPGGTVAAATWDTRGGFVVLRMILDAAAILGTSGRQARAAAYIRPLSRPGELSRLWKGAGLQYVVQETRTIRMDFASFADFWAPMEGHEGPVAAYVQSLTTDARNRLCDAVADAYVDGEPDGPRSYAATAWVVRGVVAR